MDGYLDHLGPADLDIVLRREPGLLHAGLAPQERGGVGGVGGRAAPREPQDDVEVGRPEMVEVAVHVAPYPSSATIVRA